MLIRKLHLKAGMRFAIVNEPDGFRREFGKPPEDTVEAKSLKGSLDLILLFARDKKTLTARWPKALAALKQDGALWVAYPKKTSGIKSDLAMMGGTWEVYEGTPWQPVASIAVDDRWSAVRFKYSPGLEQARERRSDEHVLDSDGTICIDRKNRVIVPPKDLQALLGKNARASGFFESLSFTNQREYVGWVIGAKRAETRADRLTATIEKLSTGKKNPSEK